MVVKLLGVTSKDVMTEQLRICASAGKLSRMPGTVFDALDSFKNDDAALAFIKRVIGMGHTSTVDHDYFVFAIQDVSPVAEQTLIGERFASFTVKSRREVNFSNVGYIIPDFHDVNGNILPNNNELKSKYIEFMNWLFQSYQKFIDAGISKEDARFCLPYSYHSNLFMGVDATALARIIGNLTKTELSKISELKELGNNLLLEALQRAPYLQVLVDNIPEQLENPVAKVLESLNVKKNYFLQEKPKLLSHTEDIDQTLIANAIARITSKSMEEAQEIYKRYFEQNEKRKKEMIKAIFADVNHDDLKQINFRFQLSIPFAILTHFTRHRRLELSIPKFSPLNDLNLFETPPSIRNSSLHNFYDGIYANNLNIVNYFKSQGVRDEDLIYFTLSGNMVNTIINFDGEALRWVARLRECNKAQWTIRGDMLAIHAIIEELSPSFSECLGPDCVTQHICSEGKESCGRINAILARERKEHKND